MCTCTVNLKNKTARDCSGKDRLLWNSRELPPRTSTLRQNPSLGHGTPRTLSYGGRGAVVNRKPIGGNWELEVWWLLIGWAAAGAGGNLPSSWDREAVGPRQAPLPVGSAVEEAWFSLKFPFIDSHSLGLTGVCHVACEGCACLLAGPCWVPREERSGQF